MAQTVRVSASYCHLCRVLTYPANSDPQTGRIVLFVGNPHDHIDTFNLMNAAKNNLKATALYRDRMIDEIQKRITFLEPAMTLSFDFDVEALKPVSEMHYTPFQCTCLQDVQAAQAAHAAGSLNKET